MQLLTRFSINSFAAVLFALAALSGCGGGESEGVCDGVTCEEGVCDPGSGTCANAVDCAGDDTRCLGGWACVTDVCVPIDGCNTDGTCDRGTCENGACVNPATCSTNTDCSVDSYCEGGTCAPDPCFDTTCERGVCQLGVGMCVNAQSCTTANEETTCLEGARCVEGSCVAEADFCADLDCDRGVCSFEELSCANPETCATDTECTTGSYCTDDGACAENRCEADMVTCPRGVCDPMTTQCVNPDSCTTASECLDGALCVGGACIPEPQACGVDGCPGNKVCAYDDNASTAVCVENTANGCMTALDCDAARICDAGVCGAGGACAADVLEPNNTAAEATQWFDVAVNGAIERLTVCDGDVDTFIFNNREAQLTDGELSINVDIVRPDIGLGVLEVELIDPNGGSVATATTSANGQPTGFANITTTVDIVTGGEYTIVVRGSGAVSGPGVRYNLTAAVLDPNVINACNAATDLPLGMPIVGDTTGSAGALATSCNDLTGSAPEAVFALDVPVDGFLDVQVTPAVGYDVALSIRSACGVDASELPEACRASTGLGGSETISANVTAGLYYIVVESEDADATGTFVLSASVNPRICTTSDNSCIDADTASVCNERGTAFSDVTCPDGCDTTTGACLQPPGDSCVAPIQVDPTTGYTGVIDWAQMQDDYDPGSNGCVPDNSNSRTDGPDAAFAVTVADGEVLTAEIKRVGSNYISAYLVSDCGDLANSCIVGVNASFGSDEFLYWRNDTGASQDVFLIADSEDWSTYGISPVTIDVATFVCQPSSARCVLNRESQVCNDAGTGYDSTIACENGCDATTGGCIVTNDLCGGAAPLTPGVTSQGTVENYVNDYESGACGGISSFEGSTDAADAVFSITTTLPNQLVTVVVDPTGFDPIVWLSTSCDASNVLGQCVNGVDGSESDGASETLEFLAATPSTYYIVVEDGDNDTSVGPFDITATVEDPECTPNTLIGCNMTNTAIESCNALGQTEEYTCNGGACDPNTNRCTNPTGQVCADAVPLDRAGGALTDQPFDNLGTDDLDFDAPLDQCNFNSSDAAGTEVIYTLDLFAGDLLNVNFTEKSTNTSDYGSIYILNDCSEAATSCQGFDGTDGNNSIQYFAQTNQTIFLVVDSRTTSTTLTFDYDLNWSVSQPGWLCQPNSRSCSGSTALICSDDGFDQDFVSCPGQCINGSCLVDAPSADTCAAAVDIGDGASIAIDGALLTDTSDIPSSDDTCFNNIYGTDGQDAFYSVTLNPYQVLEVTGYANGEFDYPTTYIFTDCGDVAGSCLTGDVGTSSRDAYVQYQAGAGTETVRIALDIDSPNTDELYFWDIRVRDPECLPTDPVVCNAAGTALELCGDFGTTFEYLCGGACSNGACAAPRGDSCYDAITLTGTSGSEDGDWSGNTNTFEPGEGRIGNCSFDDIDETDGADDLYAINLAAGDTLTAFLDTTEAQARLYFIGDCTNEVDSCLASDLLGVNDEPVAYRADVAETIYMVVDRTDTTTDNDYTLNWEITTGAACVPNAATCSDSSTLETCDANGNVAYTTTCPVGCANGACAADVSNDTCGGAIDIGQGMTVWANYDQYGNDVNFNGTCVGTAEDGADLFYSVNLLAGQVLRVRAVAIGAEDPIVFIASDCAGTENSCLAGAYEDLAGQSNDDVSVEYRAPNEQTVIIGISSESTTANEPVYIKMEVLTPDCDPATFQQVCDPSGTGFIYCNAASFQRTYACAGNGVCDATTQRCQEPVGDVCRDPFVATPAALGTANIVSGTFDGLTNDYDLGTGNMCTGSRTVGAEPVYVVDLLAGQTVTAELVSTETTPQDLSLYASESCDDVRNSCLSGSDVYGATADAETLTYTATADGPVFLFADSFYPLTSGAFDLTVTVN